jgi:hypothetical protein
VYRPIQLRFRYKKEEVLSVIYSSASSSTAVNCVSDFMTVPITSLYVRAAHLFKLVDGDFVLRTDESNPKLNRLKRGSTIGECNLAPGDSVNLTEVDPTEDQGEFYSSHVAATIYRSIDETKRRSLPIFSTRNQLLSGCTHVPCTQVFPLPPPASATSSAATSSSGEYDAENDVTWVDDANIEVTPPKKTLPPLKHRIKFATLQRENAKKGLVGCGTINSPSSSSSSSSTTASPPIGLKKASDMTWNCPCLDGWMRLPLQLYAQYPICFNCLVVPCVTEKPAVVDKTDRSFSGKCLSVDGYHATRVAHTDNYISEVCPLCGDVVAKRINLVDGVYNDMEEENDESVQVNKCKKLMGVDKDRQTDDFFRKIGKEIDSLPQLEDPLIQNINKCFKAYYVGLSNYCTRNPNIITQKQVDDVAKLASDLMTRDCQCKIPSDDTAFIAVISWFVVASTYSSFRITIPLARAIQPIHIEGSTSGSKAVGMDQLAVITEAHIKKYITRLKERTTEDAPINTDILQTVSVSSVSTTTNIQGVESSSSSSSSLSLANGAYKSLEVGGSPNKEISDGDLKHDILKQMDRVLRFAGVFPTLKGSELEARISFVRKCAGGYITQGHTSCLFENTNALFEMYTKELQVHRGEQFAAALLVVVGQGRLVTLKAISCALKANGCANPEKLVRTCKQNLEMLLVNKPTPVAKRLHSSSEEEPTKKLKK